MPNRLADETSPYLLQHRDNPVDWRPWGEEALAIAKAEDKPIFLSIGYSACHWCHVMEHESFEDEEIAKFLNEHFVCVKVDREERTDLDQIYMNAVQLLTGRGGWPMSVFLTPDLEPFFGGTYWPPAPARGMPGFNQVIAGVQDAWANRRDKITESAAALTEKIHEVSQPQGESVPLDVGLLEAAGQALEQSFDPTHGGFGSAPKFPHSMDLGVLLRLWSRAHRGDPGGGGGGGAAWLDMVRLTLDKMAAGGMYDHLGGGFHRYSVDERWLVPHFEKMLYDNALLAGVYLDAFLATGDQNYQRITRETIDYVLAEMTDPAGGFYSTEDADSPAFEGAGTPGGDNEEGLFYTWKPEEVRKVLGEDVADLFCRVYDVTPLGNFEGRSILNLPKSIARQAELMGYEEAELAKEMSAARDKLYAARGGRPRPGRDDKVLVGWNGLMIDSLARAGAALGEPRYVEAACKAADFVLAEMRKDSGRLLHSWRSGVAKLDGYLDDYTALANGLVSLYEATLVAVDGADGGRAEPQEKYLDAAAGLLDTVIEKFTDGGNGGFFYTADDHEELITRNRDLTDNATPGGNSLAATALVRLGKLTGRAEYLNAAHRTLEAASPLMERVPKASGQMLTALDLWIGPTPEVVLVGDTNGKLAAAVHAEFFPRRVLAARTQPEGSRSPAIPSALLTPAFEGKEPVGGEPTLYVCEGHACQEPVVGTDAIAKAIEQRRR
ncbi:MAG: thioredoxin domain-containing protein [Planctomycetota bacterium]